MFGIILRERKGKERKQKFQKLKGWQADDYYSEDLSDLPLDQYH